MSLLHFHRLLIGAAIAFCFGYAAWEVITFGHHGEYNQLAVAVLFTGLGIGLSYYLWRLNDFLGYGSGGPESGD